MNQVYRNKYHAGAKGLLLIVLMGVVAMASPAHAKPDKMQVCHLDAKGSFKLKDLPQGPYLGHLIHHEGDIVPVNGECVFETFEIGDTGPGGGIVFYITDGGLHGLEAAPTDQGNRQWCGYNTNIKTGADGTAVGTGAQNTIDILAGCTERPIAASTAAEYVWPNGQRDGFLPSIDELELMYYQKTVVGAKRTQYWSSTEYAPDPINRVWTQEFGPGTDGDPNDPYLSFQFNTNKGNGAEVRAVRAF